MQDDYFGSTYLRDEGTRISPITTLRDVETLASILPTGAKVLDVGCGHGRHMAEMDRLGYEVYGTDPSTGALSLLANLHPGLAERAYSGTFEEYPYSHRFDAIYSFYNSFFFDGRATTEARIMKAGGLLHPGGVLLVEYLEGPRLERAYGLSRKTPVRQGLAIRRALNGALGRAGLDRTVYKAHVHDGILRQEVEHWAAGLRNHVTYTSWAPSAEQLDTVAQQANLRLLSSVDSHASKQMRIAIFRRSADAG